jgi:hypothetical protein
MNDYDKGARYGTRSLDPVALLCWLLFAKLAGAEGWPQTLKEWKMDRSPVTLAWEARGEKRGEKRGKLEASRASLLRVLEVRLKQAPPADVAAAVQAQEDLETLNRWLDGAATVSTVADARAAVGLSTDA